MKLSNSKIKTLEIEDYFNFLLEENYFQTASLSIKVKNLPIININHISEKIITPLFPIMSISKMFVAAVIWRYYFKGYIDWDDPIIKFWPEFGKNGKEKISVKHVLSHTSGIPYHDSLPLKDFGDWGRIIEWIEDLKPHYKPGTKIEYHSLTFGWILGEIISRISGKSFEETFIEEVSKPLKLSNTMFSIPKEKISKILHLKVSNDFEDIYLPEKLQNIHKYNIILPAASAVSTANDICNFLSSISINKNGQEWLPKKIISEISRCHAEGIDSFGKYHRIGLGVLLPAGINNKYGAPRNSKTIGHGGLGIATAWKDLDSEISVSFLTTTLHSEPIKKAIHQDIFKLIRSVIS